MSPELNKEFDIILNSINKKFGKNTLQLFDDKVEFDPNSVISTGSISLDAALGIGGYKRGRIIEVIGEPSSGKTTEVLHVIANEQKNGGQCVFIDAEHALDLKYAQNLGCNIKDLPISQPDCAEDALEIANMLVKSGQVSLIVVDSVAALVPRSELEGEIGDQSIGKQAKLMSQAMRMLVGNANKTKCTVIFINQWRGNIGMGSPKIESGGKALKYYASQRVEIIRTGSEKEGNDIVSNVIKAKVLKNKCAPPFKECQFNIRFGVGIDQDQEILDLALEDGIIRKSGAWYYFNAQQESVEEIKLQGKIKSIEWLNENPEIKENIRKEILANRGLD